MMWYISSYFRIRKLILLHAVPHSTELFYRNIRVFAAVSRYIFFSFIYSISWTIWSFFIQMLWSDMIWPISWAEDRSWPNIRHQEITCLGKLLDLKISDREVQEKYRQLFLGRKHMILITNRITIIKNRGAHRSSTIVNQNLVPIKSHQIWINNLIQNHINHNVKQNDSFSKY